jgi:uroporphyrinogen decarboxylase
MAPRARVLAALAHQPVDRIPIDLGGTQDSTMCTGAFEKLKAFLGVDAPTLELSKAFEIVQMPEAVLSRLPVDTRSVFARPPGHTQSRWLDEHTLVDDWGVTYRRPHGHHQFDMVAHPLAEATTADLETYVWPDVEDPARYAGLGDLARDLHSETPYAVCCSTGDTTIFDRAWMLRGMEQFLVDLLTDPQFATALLDWVAQLQHRRHECFLAEVGPYVDAILIGDDMGTQQGPLIRPALYRALIKPYHRRYIELIKHLSPARVIMHACGSVTELVDDYIEIGVDALHPMQVSAVGMSPQSLKQRFGGRIAFWGGIDTQHLLPHGSPDDVRMGVREVIRTMGLEGGYVLAAVHNIQDDVPPENVWAMLDEAARADR